jgi:nitrite reductase/ring-hydroxylating ferredoxin subunit
MTWHTVAQSGEISPGRPKLVEVEGKEIGVFYHKEVYYAVLNVCPHARAPVCLGRIDAPVFVSPQGQYELQSDRPTLRCPWHHWEYDLQTGRAILEGIRQRVRIFPVKQEDGQIWVDV